MKFDLRKDTHFLQLIFILRQRVENSKYQREWTRALNERYRQERIRGRTSAKSGWRGNDKLNWHKKKKPWD